VPSAQGVQDALIAHVVHMERMPLTPKRKRVVARAWAQINALRKAIVHELVFAEANRG
jgi:hypothetical protein